MRRYACAHARRYVDRIGWRPRVCQRRCCYCSGAGVTITEDEFKYLVVNSPKELQPQLLSEDSARYEVLVSTLVTKTILRKAGGPECGKSDPAAYYQFL